MPHAVQATRRAGDAQGLARVLLGSGRFSFLAVRWQSGCSCHGETTMLILLAFVYWVYMVIDVICYYLQAASLVLVVSILIH